MMFTLSAPALAESTNALMQLSINSRSSIARLNEQNSIPENAKVLDIAAGDIKVTVSNGVQYVVQGDGSPEECSALVVSGESTQHNLTIKGDSGTAANVYLNNLKITSNEAAVSVSGDVVLIVEGESELHSGKNHAGVEKANDNGTLTITGSGKLSAYGGEGGAGIGGASGKPGNNITINGGTITASGKAGDGWGAGIGGGKGQGGSNITIRGGNVKAIPGAEAAGIGGGFKGNGTDISIEGGTVYAESGGGNGGTAAIGGGRAGGNGENIQITGGDITLKKAGAADIGIGGKGGEISVADTFSGTLTYLDEKGAPDADKNIVKYGITVNGEEFNSLNKDKILNGAMRYDPDTKTLSLNDSYMGTLTINAPKTNVDLNGGTYSVRQGKLVIEDAEDVTLTSPAPRAIFGDVNITCAGKLSITCENIAVDGNLTVNHASSVELIGKNDNGGTVTGAAVFNNTGEVTIQNKDATKGAAHSISYNGKDYVYFTTADGEQNDPRITPIAADASYLHIVPSELHSITVPEGCTFKVDGADLSTAHAGQPVTVTAPDKGDHFEFAGWTISPDSVTLNNADKLTATFTMPDGDVKLENSYNQLYDVTVLKGTATPSFAKEGTEIAIEAAERPGYRFERWDVLNDKVTLANKNSNTTTFNMPAGEVQVEAKYKALQSITVNDGTYTVNGETTTEAVKGDKIVATANPAPEGEKFAGWNVVGVDGLTDEQKAVSPIEFEMPKNGVELTAQYKTLRNIVVNNGTYTVNGTDDKQAVEGDKINIKAAERPGYQFVRWEVVPDNVTITGVNNEEATFIMPNENVELKARYNKLYTITVDGGHADVTSALTGKEITVDADVPDGKKFMGWKADGITLTPAQQQSKHITFFMPEGNVTLTAEYKTLHTVTVIGANGTSTVLPDTYIEGDTVTVNAADYGIPAGEFDHWESNDIRLTTDKWQSPTLTFKMVDKNVTLIAVPKTLFTITVTGGTVNGESTTARVKAGDWVTIKAENKGDDWKFIEWKLTGPENFTLDTSQSTVQFQMPSGNVTLEAVQMEYRTVTINNGNSPTTVNDKALHGDSITVTADEVDGKRFVGWTYKSSDMTFNLTDEELAKKTLNFTVPEGDVTLTANYKQLYTVTVDGELAGTVIEGEAVHVKANVPEDHEFVKWTSNVFLNGHDENAEFDFVMPVPGQNVELTSETRQLYYVTINDQGADEPTQTFVVKAGDTVHLEAAGRDGWKFIDWEGDVDLIFDNEDHTKAHFTVPSNTNVTVTAKYMKYRTITVIGGTVNGATTITDALREQEVEIKAVYDPEEQVFDHWEAEGPDGWALTEEQKGAESFTLKVPKGNVTLKAVYKTLHTVTVINGTAQNGETTIKAVAGEKITLTPNLPGDQEFDCWYSEEINLREDQRKTPELTFKMRDFDITIEAKSKQLYFVELADADTKANGESGKVEVKSGEKVTIVAPEREGWKFIRWEVSDNAYLDDATAFEAHFYMPSGNVSVKAVYYEYHTITMTDDKGTAYNEKGEEITRAVQGDVITIKAKKDREDHEFNRWVITPDNGTLVGKNDPEATFTMPDEAVVVDAKYKHLQGITVNGGAAYYMDGTPVETAKAGETIVIVAEDRSKDGLRFAYWEVNSDKEVNVEGGEKATFEMVNAPVELTAHYEAQITYSNDPAIFDEGVGLHEDIVWEKVGDTASITAVLDNSTDEDDIGTFPGMTFDYWEIVTPEKLNVTSGLNSETITFEVPECEVKLIAHWKDTTTVTPEEPLDPGFPVEPEAPADGSGAVIGVAAAGAAIWGGYEITTRVILNDLLPEGAAIPTNRGELAMLIWTQKGKPEPAAEPAFTDVSDTELAKAAQWCVEQGLLTAEDGKFEPDGWTPKWRVIQVWNQAFPKE